MKFTPTGKLYYYVSAPKQIQLEMLSDIDSNIVASTMTQIEPINTNDNYLDKEELEPFVEDIYNNDYPTQEEYFNIIYNYDDEYFRLLDLEEKMCEGLCEDLDGDETDDEESA